jgi:hypothetical protein
MSKKNKGDPFVIPCDNDGIPLIPLSSPNPGTKNNVQFIGWSKRQGCAKSIQVSKKKAQHLGADLDALVEMEGGKIQVRRSRAGETIWLTDPVWADQWCAYLDVEVPSHSQYMHGKG